MPQSLFNVYIHITSRKISPRWGYGLSVYTHFRMALPYAIDLKAFSLTPKYVNNALKEELAEIPVEIGDSK